MQIPRQKPGQQSPGENSNDAAEIEDIPGFEGIHQGVILSDQWGNEWDDTDDFSEIDFRLVDGPD
ncbi:MAG: hypothetical protein PVH46_02410 [Granulosicoccaceae bacterium]|jgi:hypothetical protein